MSEMSIRGSVSRSQCPVPRRPLAAERGPCSRLVGPSGETGRGPAPSLPLPALSFGLETAWGPACWSLWSWAPCYLQPRMWNRSVGSVGSQHLPGGALSAPHAEDFQSLGKPLPAAGEDPQEEAGRCEFLPGVSPGLEGVHFLLRKGGTLRLGSGLGVLHPA